MAWETGVSHWGDGVATEAATAMVAWLRGIGVRRLVAHIHPKNAGSATVASRLGLTSTGAVDDDGEVRWESAG